MNWFIQTIEEKNNKRGEREKKKSTKLKPKPVKLR